MQFTELSELNKVVGLMRISSCNSPTFHDRQDSEVDRIYNSSPKMEMQLRNSWIDKMASFKPMPTASSSTNAKKATTINTVNGAKAAGASANGSSAKKADAESDAKAGSKAENGKDGKDAKANGNGAADAKRRMSTAPAKKEDGKADDAKDDAKADGKKKDEGGLSFEKEDVEPLSFHEVSLLDKILKGSTVAMGPKPVMMGADGAVLHLTIYLPTRTEMKIDLYDVSTVDESIQEILRSHQAGNRQPPLYYDHPECYELRLHDADGYPDEDFPALDRSRKIKNFGDAGGHEYCLCERPDACPPTGDAPKDSAAVTTSKVEAPAVAKAAPPAGEKAFLKIYMPKSDDYTVVAIDSTTIGQDLLPTLNKKHRLQLFQDQYVLKISEAERERLELASDEIDMQTKLRPLNLHEVTLATKQYADAPQVPVTVTSVAEDTANIDGRVRPPPETFMFNDVTAGMFKEWRVIKKNKFGKKQHRMLGIDQHKMYNRKVGERVIKSRNTTKIAERPMSSVGWVRFMTDPSEFQIYFKDSIEEIVTDYTAESPYECAEIVAKLKYILSRRK
ncbi:Stress-activated map kinase interacting 1, partial [Globisporangium splendens]